ncbi:MULTISPECIES: phage portal protein [Rhodococcus]|uniref:phage portal protein n=1 Tax=Rhodococcus TaxID=1827 RepID=UPI001E2F0ECF|nr:phage portal protein [Rhodococcus pyridinivorans]MCD2116789.1 phage portal protein [Rhodococcus pyridinivorans]MCZ4626003.1 phage portal protein [Rhodococcus pyridinivorans]MCZ4646958.1 phage portal protein [Rhodococcus pyridinivorans]MDJ0480310.1 phage portal protein [Rhodococcus pyridinivorans]MDV7253061.1 phage portal protein [Rhodococcus pyridinivorans]
MSSIRPGVAWPPKDMAPLFARVAECRVQWEGAPDRLEDFYAQHPNGSNPGRIRAAWNALWGKPIQAGQDTPERLHAPIPADVASLSATALFAKPPTILATPEAGEQVQERIDDMFNAPRFHSDLYAAGESASALGGVYGRVVRDRKVQDDPWIEWVDVDRAIPDWHRGRLRAVTFFTELDGSDSQDVWRHLERYERGRVVHELYRGTSGSLGRPMPLNEHPATAGLDVNLAADGASFVDVGIDELLVEYVPNKIPNPEWSADPALRNMGASDCGAPDLVPLYHSIDSVWSSLMRDVRLGKTRVFASADVLQHGGAGTGLTFNEDQEIFTRVGTGIGKEGAAESIFEFHQPEIRVLQHDQVGEMLLREVLRKTGYSPMSFGLSDQVAQTATEASGKKESTVTTTEGKARHFGVALQHLTTACARLAGVSLVDPLDIDWPPFAQESGLARAQTVQAWETARAASTRTKVRYLHQDWTEEQVDEEAALIEAAGAVETPVFGGDAPPFGGQPAGDEQPEEERETKETTEEE